MQDKQRVTDMAVEVVDRQARVRAEWTGEPVTDPSTPPEGLPDIERLVALNQKYGVEILPPPEQ